MGRALSSGHVYSMPQSRLRRKQRPWPVAACAHFISIDSEKPAARAARVSGLPWGRRSVPYPGADPGLAKLSTINLYNVGLRDLGDRMIGHLPEMVLTLITLAVFPTFTRAQSPPSAAAETIRVGDPVVDGSFLKPYKNAWKSGLRVSWQRALLGRHMDR